MATRVRGNARRETIMRASLEVFLEGGFLGTSVDDIAAAARTAAEQLIWLVVSAPLNRLMFAPSGETALPGELDRAANTAFDLFRLAFRPPD